MTLDEALAVFHKHAISIWLAYVVEDRNNAVIKIKKLTNYWLHEGKTLSEDDLSVKLKEYLADNSIHPGTICSSFTQDERDCKRFECFNTLAEMILSTNNISDLFVLYDHATTIIGKNANDGLTQNINKRCKELQDYIFQFTKDITETIFKALEEYFSYMNSAFTQYMFNANFIKQKMESVSGFTYRSPDYYRDQTTNSKVRRDLADVNNSINEASHSHNRGLIDRWKKENERLYEGFYPEEKKFADIYWQYHTLGQLDLENSRELHRLYTTCIEKKKPSSVNNNNYQM